MGASLTALLGYDVTDPRSPHSVHVASEADVPAIPPWGRDTLHRAVRLADDRGEVVVLDHDRARLYLADETALSYRPPGTLGLGRPPALVVARPALLRPGDDRYGLSVAPFDPAALDGPSPAWPERDASDAPDTDGPTDAGTSATGEEAGDDPGPDPDPLADGSGAPDDAESADGPANAPDPDSDADGDRDAGDDPDGDRDAADDGDDTDANHADGDDAESVTVSPTFDVLVPAFDIEEQGEPAEPMERHAVETPTGVGTGTPSG